MPVDTIAEIGPFARLKAHQGQKNWFNEITRSTMEHFDSRAALEVAEVKAIQMEKPKYNIAHAGDKPPAPRPVKVRESRQAQSVFGPDASRFPQPGEEPEDLSWVRTLHIRMPLPCPECGTPFCCYRPADEYGRPAGDDVHCGWCQAEWTVEEWQNAVGIAPRGALRTGT